MDKKKFEKIFRKILYPLIVISILLLIFTIRRFLVAFIVMVLFIFANMLLGMVKRVIMVPVGLEVETLGTIVCSMLYGVGAGVFFAIFSITLGAITQKTLSVWTLVKVLVYIGVAITTTLFSPANIIVVGISLTIVATAIIFIFCQLFFSPNLLRNIGYAVTTIILNFFIFKYAAQPIVNLLT